MFLGQNSGRVAPHDTLKKSVQKKGLVNKIAPKTPPKWKWMP